jgi:outer membrane protein assembly factor BamB
LNLRTWAIGAVLAAMSLGTGCAEQVRSVMPHPRMTPGARANLELALIQQVTIPDYGVLNPDEFAAVTPDPARKLVYVGTRGGDLVALSMETGEVAWEHKFPGAVSSVPALAEDGALLLLGTDNGDLVALELETRKARWTYSTLGTIRNAPLIVGGTVHVVNSRDQVFALDLKTGGWRWQYDQPYPTEFTVHGHAGLSHLAGEKPVEKVAEKPVEGEKAAEGEPAAVAQVAPGTLFTGFSNGKVGAIGAETGEAQWLVSVAPPGGGDFIDSDGTPLVIPERGEIVVTGQSTGVYGLAIEDGSQRWHRPMRGAGSVIAGPRGLMVVASALEGVFALEHGGRVRWRQQLDPGFVQAPLIVGDIAFVAHSDSGLLAFDVETGELLANLDTGSGISGPPVHDPVFSRFYTLTNRGMLVVFRTVGEA